MDNLKVWNTFNQPPKTALKQIEAGRMKGKTDINPQWRYKAMTETFGIVGLGWKFTVDKMWTEQGADGEVFAFVNVSVFIKADGEWSDAIPGSGGATLVVKEKNGMYNDDDAFKKATTDALSTAMKMLGVAADVYAGGWDGAKYKQQNEKPTSDRRAELVKRYNELSDKASAAGLHSIPVITAEMTEKQIETTGIELAERIKKEGK